MKTLQLYIKQHTVTGKKYLGITSKDVRYYNGSGSRWKKHIKYHGSEYVETIWTSKLYQSDDKTIIKHARRLSKLFDIVNNDEFLNLEFESGIIPTVNGYLADETLYNKRKAMEKYDRTGDKTNLAKTYIFINPHNEEFVITGAFASFCKQNNISKGKMYQYVNKGVIPFVKNECRSNATLACVGWTVTLINGESYTNTRPRRTWSEKSKNTRIKHNAPSAKSFKFISPTNNEYVITGEFLTFCKEHNLSEYIIRKFMNTGIIKPEYIKPVSQNVINCIGWQIFNILDDGTTHEIIPLTKSMQHTKDDMKIKFSGNKTNFAKKFLFISPTGINSIVHGEFINFCNNHELSLCIIRKFVGYGIIQRGVINQTFNGQAAKNCINWTVYELDINDNPIILDITNSKWYTNFKPKYKFISPDNIEYETTTIKSFCKEYALSVDVMTRFINNGIVHKGETMSIFKSSSAKNCFGWQLIKY
jgi:hypothetical protein